MGNEPIDPKPSAPPAEDGVRSMQSPPEYVEYHPQPQQQAGASPPPPQPNPYYGQPPPQGPQPYYNNGASAGSPPPGYAGPKQSGQQWGPGPTQPQPQQPNGYYGGGPPVQGMPVQQTMSGQPYAAQHPPLHQITVGGRTFRGYVQSTTETNKKTITRYVEVLPDGSTRIVTVTRNRDDDGLTAAEAGGLGACAACLLCCCCIG